MRGFFSIELLVMFRGGTVEVGLRPLRKGTLHDWYCVSEGPYKAMIQPLKRELVGRLVMVCVGCGVGRAC